MIYPTHLLSFYKARLNRNGSALVYSGRRTLRMKSTTLGKILAIVGLAVGAAMAAVPTDADLAKSIRHEVLMYPRYSMWDDISFRVNNGNVELLGAVNQPYKRDDIGRLAKNVAGVETVTNNIRVL